MVIYKCLHREKFSSFMIQKVICLVCRDGGADIDRIRMHVHKHLLCMLSRVRPKPFGVLAFC